MKRMVYSILFFFINFFEVIASMRGLIFAPMNFRQNIPNYITLGNLFCGCLAIALAPTDIEHSVFFVLLAALLDFLDGLAARLLGVSSSLGKQLDSLADLVSFGVAPALWVFLAMQQISYASPAVSILSFSAFVLAIGGAWRLARFNIDSSQENHFKGLPIPANGIFWIGFFLSINNSPEFPDENQQLILLPCLVILFTYLMVSRIKLLSFKFSHLRWAGNASRFILILLSAVTAGIIILAGYSIFFSIPVIVLLYITTSIFHFSAEVKNVSS